MFEIIRNKIKSKLEDIGSIEEVEDYPTDEWNGFPAAMVVSTRNESEFQTTVENKRTYVFTVYILQEIESQGKKKARRIIEGVVDDIMEDFDKDQLLSGIEDSLPDNEDIIISFPMLSSITNDEKYAYAELEINVMIQFNTET